MKRWKDNWDAIAPIFKFSTTVRKVIYTTNAIESLNSTYRKLNRQRSVFPSDTALLKALYLATFEATKNGRLPFGTGHRSTGNWVLCARADYQKQPFWEMLRQAENPACSWHADLQLLYIKQGRKALWKNFSPFIIIEEPSKHYFTKNFHTLRCLSFMKNHELAHL